MLSRGKRQQDKYADFNRQDIVHKNNIIFQKHIYESKVNATDRLKSLKFKETEIP